MVLIGILVLLSAALLAPGLLIGPSLDAAVFSHVAGRMLDGVPLYLGTWDHKPPGMYLASAAAQMLLGGLGPWTAQWLLSVAATAGIGLSVAAVLTREGVTGMPRAFAAVGTVLFAGQYLLSLGGGLTEPLATAMVGFALVGVIRPAGPWRAAAVGVLAGAALLVSLQVLPGVLVVGALATVGAPASARLPRVALLSAGLAAPALAVLAWLTASGTLAAALDAIVVYTAAYRALSGGLGTVLGVPVVAWTLLSSVFVTALAAFGLASALRAPEQRRRVAMASALWIGASCVLVVAQGRFYAHYAIPLAVPLGILAGYGLGRVAISLRGTHAIWPRALIVAPLAIAMTISLVAGIAAASMEMVPLAQRSSQMEAVSSWLRGSPARSGTMLVWGNEPHLYDLSGRMPAIRFSYFYPLTTAGYSTPSQVAEVAKELADQPPAVIVDASTEAPGVPGFVPLLTPHPLAREGRELDLLEPLRAFVAEHYELAATVDGWPIYLLRVAVIP
ncbi:MAG: hypothetical protein ABI978_04800 [Chloroflexota bacterium]